jgi:hypothetical protein
MAMTATTTNVTTELKKEMTTIVITTCKVHQAMEVGTEGLLQEKVIALEIILSLGGQISIMAPVTVKVLCSQVLGDHPLLEAPILLTEAAPALEDLTRGKFTAIADLVGQGLPQRHLGGQGLQGATHQEHTPLLIMVILGQGHP